jgi:methylglyoxal synthase
LEFHNLFATGETGKRIMEKTGLKLTVLKGGSYGGDMELGADCQREIGSLDSEIRTACLLSLF